MALYIQFSGLGAVAKECHIPFKEDLCKEVRRRALLNEVVHIEADGHELAFLLQRFKNIPQTFSSCRWDGELARFIAMNFPYP